MKFDYWSLRPVSVNKKTYDIWKIIYKAGKRKSKTRNTKHDFTTNKEVMFKIVLIKNNLNFVPRSFTHNLAYKEENWRKLYL